MGKISYSNDVFFHYALTGEDADSKALREELLYQILNQRFEIIDVLDPTLYPDSFDGKTVVLDVLIKNEKGELINIEMQVSSHSSRQSKRFQYYNARALTHQLEEGDDYEKLE